MSLKGSSLAGWTQTRNTIWENWNLNHLARRPLAYSEDPDSAYQRYTRNLVQLEQDSIRHYDTGLRQVDDRVSAATLAALKTASQKARDETDRIARATADVEKVTAVVNRVTEVVTGFAGVVL